VIFAPPSRHDAFAFCFSASEFAVSQAATRYLQPLAAYTPRDAFFSHGSRYEAK